ncbi:MAG: DUF523 domain-containing protein [Clostridia bacterium]|nr:DUF523 domain-containing protein [Clostridia bacterium]
MANILVSACLLGICCRYKGDGCENGGVLKLLDKHTLIPVCPEQLGGLRTPRAPSEIVNGSVVNNLGEDVTKEYTRGAQAALRIAQLNNVKLAILKSRSPSCGSGLIYDGSFTGKKIPGDGVCAALLKQNGIKVITEDELDTLSEEEL